MVAEQCPVREPGQRIVKRLFAHPLGLAQPRHRAGERVRDGSHEADLIVRELPLGRDEQLALRADRHSSAGLRQISG